MEMIALVFIVGLAVGSFLNVCIYRIPLGQTVVTTPSHCFHCGANLRPWDLIPIFSFLLLGGKCRYCKAKLSWQYPLVEFITGLLFVAAFYQWGISWSALAMAVFFSVLVVATVIDLYHRIIPDGLLLVAGVLGLPLVYLQSLDTLKWGVIGFLTAGLVMYLIAVVSKGGMGGGDIKLAAIMGLYLSLKPVALALLLAFVLGGVIGLVLLASGKKGRKDALPFGPFLAMGSVLAALAGDKMIHWYIGIWLT